MAVCSRAAGLLLASAVARPPPTDGAGLRVRCDVRLVFRHRPRGVRSPAVRVHGAAETAVAARVAPARPQLEHLLSSAAGARMC